MTSRVDNVALFARWRTRMPALPEGSCFLIVGVSVITVATVNVVTLAFAVGERRSL